MRLSPRKQPCVPRALLFVEVLEDRLPPGSLAHAPLDNFAPR